MTKIQLIPLIRLSTPERLIVTTKVLFNGSSLKITLPKEVTEKLKLWRKDHIEFYEISGKIE